MSEDIKKTIKENKNKDKKLRINKKNSLKYFNSDFTELATKILGKNYIKNEEALDLIKKRKIKFLKKIKKEVLEKDKEEQRIYYKNLKCKDIAIHFLTTNNYDILKKLQKYIKDGDDKYIRIRNYEGFENVIKSYFDENISLELIKAEEKNIEVRFKKLNKIADDLIYDVKNANKNKNYVFKILK